MADRSDDNHPCRDPELLERYALGGVTSPERMAIDEHCRDCAECRRLLEEELSLAAGVRRTARIQMKRRLAERLSSARRREIPWSRIAAVAATIIVVAGVSVIGVWIRRSDSVPAPPPEAAAPPYAAEHDMNRTGTPAIPPAAKEQHRPDRPPSPPGKGSVLAQKDIPGAEKSEGVASETKSRAAEAVRESERAADAAVPREASVRSEFGEGYWTEGIVSEEPAATGAAHRDNMNSIRRPAPEIQSRAAQKAAAQPVALNQQVALSQQPSRLLQGQELQLRAKKKAVPTLVRQVDGHLSLTLYPDSLFPPQDLQQAIVRRSGDDSLLIQVGSQLIRYRLPSSLLQQLPAR